MALPGSFDDLGHTLARYIGRQLHAPGTGLVEFGRLSGGAIQNNYAITVDVPGGSEQGRREYVVRTDAPSRIAASLTRPQEFQVLGVAHKAGVTVPRPYWLCTDTALIGDAFYVMARVRGSASPRQLVGGKLSRDHARELTRQLGLELARLHQVRPPNPGLAFMPVPGPSPAVQRINHYRTALEAIPEPHPVLEFALNWLEDHVPGTNDVVLCHGDFRTGNYMVEHGRLTAILDWEFAAWSDPYEDLGWLCSRSWRFGHNELEVGGMGDKAALFDGYSGLSGQRVVPEKVLYWEVMAMTRWAIIALQQAQRHLSGQQLSLELALTGRLLPEIEFDLLAQIHELGV